MKTKSRNRLLPMLLAGALTAMLPTWAMAYTARSHTPACTSITNTASVSYSVGAFSDTKSGTSSAFTVAAKIDFTVERQDGSAVSVYPGSTGKVLTFKVYNAGNVKQKYALTAAARATGSADPFGGANDSFDMSNADMAIGGSSQSGMTGTTASAVDPDGSVTVTITADDLTSSLSAGATSVYRLTAVSKHTDGAAVTQNGSYSVTSSAGTCTTDTVIMADSDDTHTVPADYDNTEYVDDTYVVATGISISKSSSIVADPVNGTSSPKYIPGAVVEYTVTVSNANGAPNATGVSVSDTLPSNLKCNTNATYAYAAGKNIKVTAPNLYSGAETALTDVAADDEGQCVADVVTVSGITLNTNESATVKFRAEIR